MFFYPCPNCGNIMNQNNHGFSCGKCGCHIDKHTNEIKKVNSLPDGIKEKPSK